MTETGFDRTGFVGSQPASWRRFVEEFTGTQVFEGLRMTLANRTAGEASRSAAEEESRAVWSLLEQVEEPRGCDVVCGGDARGGGGRRGVTARSGADPRVFAPAELEVEDGDDAGRGGGGVVERGAAGWKGVSEAGEEVVWGEDGANGDVRCLLGGSVVW